MALRDNLISWWSLDETSGTRNDSHGSNHLTDNNTVLYGTGKKSNAGDFEDTNSEYLSITDGSQTGLDPSTNMTWSFWFNCESTKNGFVIGKYAGSGQEGYAFQVMADDAGDGIRVWRATDSFTLYSSTINTSTWYHCFVLKSGSTVSVYLNNSEIGTATTMTLNGTTADFRIGDLQKYAGNGFDGLIDEVAVWSRVLDSTERSQIYNSGNGLDYAGTAGASIKTVNGLAIASVKTVNGLAIASVKTVNGLA